MNIIEELEREQIEQLASGKKIPEFTTGDTVRVLVKVVEGNRERIQAFEGVCIARKNAGINSSFTVRKISYGEGVERIFPLYSPRIEGIELVRRGKVRRAKLYYLRGRMGKSARIAERTRGAGRGGVVSVAAAADMSEGALKDQAAPPLPDDQTAEAAGTASEETK